MTRPELASSPHVDCPGGQRRHVRRLIALAILALIVVACGNGEPEPRTESIAEGVVVDVQGTLTEVQSFELTLPDGSRLTFVPEAGVLERSGFSPSHLREHAGLGQPVSVRYLVVEGEHRVTSIGDVEGG